MRNVNEKLEEVLKATQAPGVYRGMFTIHGEMINFTDKAGYYSAPQLRAMADALEKNSVLDIGWFTAIGEMFINAAGKLQINQEEKKDE